MTVVWITGLPASGKSTLARELHGHLPQSVILDGDAMRAALGATSYAPADRDAYYRSLANIAAMIARQGLVTIVPATAPTRAQRDLARSLAPGFLEVYIDTPLDECRRRDPKRLYETAPSTLPGVGTPYEPPLAPSVIAHGGHDETAIETTLALLKTSTMPYATNADLPPPVRKILPRHAQDIFRAAFNNAIEHYGASREATAHRVAWAAVKRKYLHAASGVWIPRSKRA
ncbi:MAG: ChaB family protein [Kofleriaceae bacterium]